MKLTTFNPTLPKLKNLTKQLHISFKTRKLTNNQKNVILFEKKLKNLLKTKYNPVVFCNGELALYSIIKAWKYKLGLNKRDNIKALVPSLTFVGTINALYLNNIQPVFCDVDQTLTIDVKSIKKIHKDVKFIVPVSVYGNITNLPEILKFSKLNNLKCISDSAPGFGSSYNNKNINNFGIDEIYSFHISKIFNTIEGGVAITNNKSIHRILRNLREFGQSNKKTGDVTMPGLNSKMQEFNAIVGINNLKFLNQDLKNRKKIIEKYQNFFNKLEAKKYIQLMKVEKNVMCQYLYFPIIVKSNREKFIKYLEKNNIIARKYYTSVKDLTFYKNKFKCYKENNCKCEKYCEIENSLNYTESIKNKIVSLPLGSNISTKKVDYLFETILKYFND